MTASIRQGQVSPSIEAQAAVTDLEVVLGAVNARCAPLRHGVALDGGMDASVGRWQQGRSDQDHESREHTSQSDRSHPIPPGPYVRRLARAVLLNRWQTQPTA
jgi:hypothetical protein